MRLEQPDSAEQGDFAESAQEGLLYLQGIAEELVGDGFASEQIAPLRAIEAPEDVDADLVVAALASVLKQMAGNRRPSPHAVQWQLGLLYAHCLHARLGWHWRIVFEGTDRQGNVAIVAPDGGIMVMPTFTVRTASFNGGWKLRRQYDGLVAGTFTPAEGEPIILE